MKPGPGIHPSLPLVFQPRTQPCDLHRDCPVAAPLWTGNTDLQWTTHHLPWEALCKQGKEHWTRSPGVNVWSTISPFSSLGLSIVIPATGGLDLLVSSRL